MVIKLIKYKPYIVAILLLQLCFLCHSQSASSTIITYNISDSIINSFENAMDTADILPIDTTIVITDTLQNTIDTEFKELLIDSVMPDKKKNLSKKTTDAGNDPYHIKPKPYDEMPDSIYDKLYGIAPDYLTGDSLKDFKRHQRALRRYYLRENFLPDPNKSLWYSLTFPGLGQIYNRKYWKLPIVYGCFVGVTYAIVWTSNQYSDYMRGYKEACDVDPNTNYHLKLLPAGYPENQAEQYMLTQLNSFRRYRDLCIVAGVAVFALSVIDAYVDAQLANFDVSPDLSMKIRPKFDTVYNTGETAVGCQVQFNF
ncbi:MAG: DUF5683 domain-containing protein [Candidatus Aphodosoma sp.]